MEFHALCIIADLKTLTLSGFTDYFSHEDEPPELTKLTRLIAFAFERRRHKFAIILKTSDTSVYKGAWENFQFATQVRA